VAEDEELNLEDLNKSSAADGDVAVREEISGGTALDNVNEDEDTEIARTAADLETVFDIPVHVTAVLGKSRMRVSQLLKLGRGAVIELDRKVGEAIDIYVNNRLVARGEVVVVEDRLGVTMTEIIKADRR
jgi:flagellar motor switch protein FliN